MKKKKGFSLRDICGEKIIIAEGRENIDFSKIISMNDSSAYLWTSIGDKEFSKEELTELLTNEYEIDEETAQKDVCTLVNQWLDAGIIQI